MVDPIDEEALAQKELDHRLTKPSIHLNGSQAQLLRDNYFRAACSIREALKHIEDTIPNARDYYVQSTRAFGAAIGEHDARCDKLREVYNELSVLFEHVQGEIDKRETQKAGR